MIINTQNFGVNFYFYFFTNVHHPSPNWNGYLYWWFKERENLKLEKSIVTTHLNTFGSNLFVFGLENHEFWKCIFNKSCSFLFDKEHGCIISMMHDQGVLKILKHSCKLGVINTKFGFIDQHMNVTCIPWKKSFSMQAC